MIVTLTELGQIRFKSVPQQRNISECLAQTVLRTIDPTRQLFSTTVVPRALSWSYFALRKLAKCVLRRVIAYSVRHLAGSCCLPLCGVYQRPSFALGPLEGAFSSAEGLEHSSVARGRRHTWSQYSRLITSQRRDNVTVAVACNHRASRKDT